MVVKKSRVASSTNVCILYASYVAFWGIRNNNVR
ncbi:hypothetical protein LINGRAHAP2_LOCUS27569 [Linum grandiflorum]